MNEDDRRYHCVVCMDIGIVRVWNPNFVEAYREHFQQGELPKDWFGKAYSWWRRNGSNPMEHMALCNCDCPRRRVLAAEREKYIQRQRRTIPACGMADYLPDKMPLATHDPKSDLTAWYAQHKPNSTYDWQPNASDYETIVGGENA